MLHLKTKKLHYKYREVVFFLAIVKLQIASCLAMTAEEALKKIFNGNCKKY